MQSTLQNNQLYYSQQQQHYHSAHYDYGYDDDEHDEQDEYYDDERQFYSEEEEDEEIDFSLVYALYTFVANLEGQVCVLKGDSLDLLDDSNSYWWLVKCIKTDEIGYIPAENVETPYERLARINKIKNVRLASVQAQDLLPAAPDGSKPKRNIFFSEQLVDYFQESDDEYYEEEDEAEGMGFSENTFQPGMHAGGSDTTSTASSGGILGGGMFGSKDPQHSPSAKHTPAPSQKAAKSSGWSGRGLLQRILGKNKKDKLSNESLAVSDDRPMSGIVSRTEHALQNQEVLAAQNNATHQEEVPATEPITVLRIYAGNVDLKATFKSVALTKDSMSVKQALEASLRRFRVPNTGDYYLAVLHMDSQEKALQDDEDIHKILDNLRNRHLPGIGDSSRVAHAVGTHGRVSSVRMNDDNIIKFIINKKLNILHNNNHLVRIYMYDSSDPHGKMRSYKTIPITNDMLVMEVIEVAKKKFKVGANQQVNYHLIARVETEELRLVPQEPMQPLFEAAGKIEFVLWPEWTGSGSAPEKNETRKISDTDEIANLIASKPSFLQEVPNSSSAAYIAPMPSETVSMSRTGSGSSPGSSPAIAAVGPTASTIPAPAVASRQSSLAPSEPAEPSPLTLPPNGVDPSAYAQNDAADAAGGPLSPRRSHLPPDGASVRVVQPQHAIVKPVHVVPQPTRVGVVQPQLTLQPASPGASSLSPPYSSEPIAIDHTGYVFPPPQSRAGGQDSQLDSMERKPHRPPSFASLKEMYNGIEADIDQTLAQNQLERENEKRKSLKAAVTAGMELGLSTFVHHAVQNGSPSDKSSDPSSSTPTDLSEPEKLSSAVQGRRYSISARRPSLRLDGTVPLPMSEAGEWFRDTDLMLNTMIRDLDNFCASSLALFSD
ncbi:uncharacterized protein BJ171DRAFT_268071 [Polychytrium aggregatum]|uniref:uncharacterized protein n=1 Tax=Polychytrium aggregatum TaxID=110093 RepID=UPI0022FEBDEE|nr:uncharacterized protein BJ171DRAFT_268071 [Polychytrium aggregatum]KAI9193370.1 hypothetical protein BJ171DRAFT_268071 [Polychytrium aggregatum]